MSQAVRSVTRRAASARRRWTATVGTVVVPAVIATLAVLYPGAPVAQVDLNDGAVWVTNASRQLVGRYNATVDDLNSAVASPTSSFDVLQDRGDVVVTSPGAIAVVDPAAVALSNPIEVPPDADVSLAGETVAVGDSATGEAWARTMAMVGTLSTATDPADLELGPGGRVVVAPDGTVLGAAADGGLVRARVTDDGVSVEDDGALAGALTGDLDQVTAVGDALVALVGTTVHTPSGEVDLAAYGDGLTLQQPGAAAPVVLVATRTSLLEVSMGGTTVRERLTGGTGKPAAPVRVGSCVHGAWASAVGSYLQLCDGDAPEVSDLEAMTATASLVFRVNRAVVVLNDTGSDGLWVPSEDPELREPSWQDVDPEDPTDQDDQDTEDQQTTQDLQAECTAQSAKPVAVDDELGVRAGRSTILPVLDNDSSSDCGILAISEFDPVPVEFGRLDAVYGGRALQLTAAPGATGTVSISYTITDGRGDTPPSTATVVLSVHEAGVNAAPVQLRLGAATVEQGASVSYDVLPDFADPDGDLLLLAEATVDGGDSVRSRQDGVVLFQSNSGTLGRQTVRVLVSDGTATVEGTLFVDVRPVGSVPPHIDPVHAVTFVDQPVVVRPLESVRSTSSEPVRLAGVDEVLGATIVTDLTAGTFSFTSATPGTYYVSFIVTAAPVQSTGIARIDVRERPETTPAPIAVMDIALLPPGGEVTIAPLANDVNPAGNVLVLQSVEAAESTGLQLAPLERELLRISSLRVLTAPVTVHYTMSNGSSSVVGEIHVIPVPAPATQQAPVVADVDVTVRTGGTVTIPVLEGASDPDGDDIDLLPTLELAPGVGEGFMFVSGDVLRFQAPATPMEVTARFVVQDSAANATAGVVRISVHASDAATKSPPRPVAVNARVFAGEIVRIRVPLTGIDTDGDGVLLLGQDEAPLKGRVVEVGADWIDYEALPGEFGTDTFTYAVEDWVGQRAVATVRVGIAPRPTTATDVIARNDDVLVRPGRTVEVRVLANDVDTGGGDLQLDPGLLLSDGAEAVVEGRRVVVRTPDSPGVLQIGYTARNDRGGQGAAVLTVTVSDDAPYEPPIARDVVVPASDTINRSTVEVDVLGVAANPSGPISDLEVSVHSASADVATVTPSGTVLITLTSTPRTLPYALTNTAPGAEGQRAYAFITVPALGDFPPILRPGAPALRVVAGAQLTIPLAEYVQVAPGRTAQIIDAASVTATRSDGTSPVRDARTLVYTAQRAYAGPASISFEVADGPSGDVTARTRVLTLPITVLAVEDYPPTFTPSVLDVGPGESTQVDLARFTSGPGSSGTQDDAEFTYRLTSDPTAEFAVTLDGSVLTVSAGSAVRRGTVGGVGLEIGYGVAGRLPVVVDLRVVASSRPLARVLDQQILGVEGQSRSVTVLDGAFNPFPDVPLTVIDATVETPLAGTASVSPGVVTIRPAPGFVGQMVTRFQVRDATTDPDRVVEGRIVTTVRGRPSTPTSPRVVEVGDQAVVLAWEAPANNGEPITGYRVTVQPGGDVRACAATTCTIDGLTNDTEYTFTVAAQNAVDWSDASPSSAPARPDAAPQAPATPSVVRGDARVTVTWSAPENTGSPIREYQVEVSPAASGGATFSTSSTSLVLTGLENGTAYRVRVRAINNAPDPGAWSGQSVPVVPAREPDAPRAVAASVGSVLGDPVITVTWDAPASDGGDPVTTYDVSVDGAWTEVPGGGAARSYSFPAVLGREYAISVRATNTLGTGPSADQTGRVWATPSVVRALTARDLAAPGTAWGAGAVELTWSPPADAGGEGITIVGYRVEVVGGATTETTATSAVLGGLVGATAYQVRVQAHSSQDEWSPAVTVGVTPTTVPDVVVFSEPDLAAAPTVRFAWSAPLDGGRPVTRYEVQVRGDRGTRVDVVQIERTIDVVATGGETLTITVRARNDVGQGLETVLADVVVPGGPGG